jgi:hypothetical protein
MNTYYATAEIARQRRCAAETQARRHLEANSANETTSAGPTRPGTYLRLLHRMVWALGVSEHAPQPQREG